MTRVHNRTVVLLSALVACQRPLVKAGGDTLTLQDAIAQWENAGRPELQDARAFVLENVQGKVLAKEAVTRGLGSNDAPASVLIAELRNQLIQEVTTSMRPQDVTDEQLMPFYKNDDRFRFVPRRASVTGAVFVREEDAKSLAASAKAATFSKDFARVSAAAARALRPKPTDPPVAETWEFDLTAKPEPTWPEALGLAALAAKEGSLVGPMPVSSPLFKGQRFAVLLVREQRPETNSFQSIKESIRSMSYMQIVAQQADLKLQQIVQDKARIDEAELAKLQKHLTSARKSEHSR